MSVIINEIDGNQVTIVQTTPASVSLQNIVSNAVSITQQASVSVSLQNALRNAVSITQPAATSVSLVNQEPIAVTINSQISSGGVWGSITGTITNQTDLVNYVAGQIPSTPDLAQVLQAGNEATEYNIVVKKVGIAYENTLSYTLPARDGSVDQVIQTDGNGSLRFVDLPASATWGNITGTLSDQTDLQSAIDAKEDVSNKSTSTSLGTSNTLYPSQNAVKSYVDSNLTSKENISNKSTDVTMGGASPSSTLYTSQYAVSTYVQNEIAAAQAGIPTFEIDMFANYKLFEYDEDGSNSYLGQIKATNGNWLITKFVDNSGDISATYANESNNATYTTPSTAWAARTSLTYQDINDLTSI